MLYTFVNEMILLTFLASHLGTVTGNYWTASFKVNFMQLIIKQNVYCFYF